MKIAISSWRELLDGISRTHTTRPDVSNVKKITNLLDKLEDAILAKIREREEAEQELRGIHEAMDTLEKEVTAALEKNTLRRRDIMLQLNKLQLEMCDRVARCEIKTDVPVLVREQFPQQEQPE